MKSQKSYFQEAVSNFTADVAYIGAVRHLYDLGLSVSQIKEQILFPVSTEKIEAVIQDYEAEKKDPKQAAHYVEDIDQFGKRSFRKVP